jgi:exodeoxyribonuclease V alpha subunit
MVMASSSTSLLSLLLQSNRICALDHALGASLKRLRPDTSEIACALVAITSYAHSLGHSVLPLSNIALLWSDKPEFDLPSNQDLHSALADSAWLTDQHSGVIIVTENGLALRRYWNYEHAIAERIKHYLQQTPLHMHADVEAYWQTLFSDQTETAQAIAVKRSYENRFFVLTGGPGTGKTTVVGKLLALLCFSAAHTQQAAPRIALAAPTGKAAMRMTEALRTSILQLVQQQLLSQEQHDALSLHATTLHRLLGYQPNSIHFLHNEQLPLPIDVLVIDEASMIDIALLSKTLDALPENARIIIIGDSAQLPPIEIGHPLHAMHSAFTGTESLVQKNMHVHLDYAHRQRDAMEIFQAAAMIKDGNAQGFMAYCLQQAQARIEWSSDQLQLDTVLLDQAVALFRAMAASQTLEIAFSLGKQFRVLCASRDDAFGIQHINHYIKEQLRAGNQSLFFKGQCLMITANHPREQLYNGDLGICWPDDKGHLKAWFETADGMKAWHLSALPAHEDAFAITIHKAQGSEFDHILLLLPNAEHRVLSRELLYTGITRARHRVQLWASAASIEVAIATPTNRWTQLASMIKN